MLDGFMNLLFESFVNALLSFLCSKFFQAEKDPTKKKKFAEDLKNEQGELDIFVINQETGQEFNYVVVCMLQLVHRTAQNDKIINEIVSNCLFCIWYWSFKFYNQFIFSAASQNSGELEEVQSPGLRL